MSRKKSKGTYLHYIKGERVEARRQSANTFILNTFGNIHFDNFER